jgi:hypothetical protein
MMLLQPAPPFHPVLGIEDAFLVVLLLHEKTLDSPFVILVGPKESRDTVSIPS